MATELLSIQGTTKYARLFEHNRDLGATAGQNGAKWDYPEATSLDLYVEQDQLQTLLTSHPNYSADPTEDGMKVRLKRQWVNSINPAWGGTPSVVDKDGTEWDPRVAIGDGSLVEAFVDVYDSKAPSGKSMRLRGVRVLEHVEFVPEEGSEGAKLPWE
jgi:hypothetical protein